VAVVRPVISRARRAPAVALAAALLCLAYSAPAQNTGRQARHEALAAIPFARLTPQSQAKLRPVLTNPSIYRRMPVKTICCDPDLYLFLVRYPEVIINIWDLMGATKVDLRRTGDYTFRADDGQGTKTDVELVFGTADTHVMYAEGVYSGSMWTGDVKARCVVLLRSGYRMGPERRVHVDNQMDIFIKFDHLAAGVIARTLHPVVGPTADSNFEQTAAFLSRLNRLSEKNSPGMQRLAGKLHKVTPAVRQRFAQLAAQVGVRAAKREEQPGDPRSSALPCSEQTTVLPAGHQQAAANVLKSKPGSPTARPIDPSIPAAAHQHPPQTRAAKTPQLRR